MQLDLRHVGDDAEPRGLGGRRPRNCRDHRGDRGRCATPGNLLKIYHSIEARVIALTANFV
jgi:hypothetical protein